MAEPNDMDPSIEEIRQMDEIIDACPLRIGLSGKILIGHRILPGVVFAVPSDFFELPTLKTDWSDAYKQPNFSPPEKDNETKDR